MSVNSKKPFLSVCIITYNHKTYISQAIEGALMQKTNFDFELVIGEDCSIDGTQEIVFEYAKKYPDIIKVITSDKNVGAISNFIRTLNACQGKYIAICEGDDYWTDPYKLQKQVDFLEANPKYGLVSSDVNLIDENGQALPDNNMVLQQRANYKPTIDFFDLLKVNLINTLTVCVRADLIKELANRVVKENLWFVFDYWFWLSISQKTKIKLFNEKLAAYRIHEQGISRQPGWLNNRIAKVIHNILKNYLNQDKKFNEREKEILFTKLFYVYKFLNSKNKKWARKMMFKYHPNIAFFLLQGRKKVRIWK